MSEHTVRVYNTLTRRKERLVPLDPAGRRIRMYVCGVTVYDVSHIGHARSAIVFDVIRRYLVFKGYDVTFVKNFTDVDDNIIRRANKEGVDTREVTERYIAAYRRDMAALGVQVPDVEPKATDHVAEMVALIERLIACGVGYVVDGDVYFEVRRFPPYGRLSGKNIDDLRAGARVDVDERKRDPLDFALWKATKPGEPAWPSPWGAGRPGWHVECSAMSMKYLGESFDIHGGGEDLIFPHHENEIAQSEACTHQSFARYWIHNGFVNIGAEKMSKSLGNTLTIEDLVRRHDGEALRLYLLGTHYRSPLEFTEDRVAEAARALDRLRRLPTEMQRLAATAGPGAGGRVACSEPHSPRPIPPPQAPPSRPPAHDERLSTEVARLRGQFEAAMDDDFNTPQALGVMFDLSRTLYGYADLVGRGERAIQPLIDGVETLVALGHALGLLERSAPAREAAPELRAQVDALVAERTAARRARDFKRSDAIRAEVDRLGFVIEDTPTGPRVTPKAQ